MTSNQHDVAMSTSTIHQSAPGGQGAHFRVVHDAVPQFGGSIVLNLITIDLIRGVIGHQYIIGVIAFGRRNKFQHADCARLFFGEGASDDERMTSCSDHNLSFKWQCGFVPLDPIVRAGSGLWCHQCASRRGGTSPITLCESVPKHGHSTSRIDLSNYKRHQCLV